MYQYKEIIKSVRSPNTSNIYLLILILHGCLFLTLIILALLIFQLNIYNLWYAGEDCPYCNDSWRFIENTLSPIHPPYPYHLIATSLHYLPLFIIMSLIFPSSVAMVLAVFIIQFSASLVTLFLLYRFFLETFELDTRQSLVLIFIFDFILISPFLLLATSEILFLFYQTLAWTCLVRQQYFFAAMSTAMTFALRFNGAFFVIGILFVLFLKWWERKDISKGLLIKICLTGMLMFIVGFSSFILSGIINNNFWLPLIMQNMKYQVAHEYAVNGALSFPFIWWFTYIQYVIQTNSPVEYVYLLMALITLGLGIFSLITLLKWLKKENMKQLLFLTILFVIGFLGVNLVVSGRDFSRFLSHTFPVFPAIPYWLRTLRFSSLLFLIIGAGIWALMFNMIWWLTYPI